MYQAALDMRRHIYGNQDHPDIASSMNDVAFETALVSGLKNALPMSARHRFKWRERLKSPHLFRYSALLGTIELYTGDAAGAAKAFEESIDSLEQARISLGGDDQDRMGFMSLPTRDGARFVEWCGLQLCINNADSAAECLDRGRAKSLLDNLERGERLTDGDLL